MCKLCWTLLLLLLLAVGLAVYRFGVIGSVAPSRDGRATVLLGNGERDLVLAEMRAFLEAVQAITQGLANDELKTVAQAARKVGHAAQRDVPLSLMAKLPLGFKRLGLDTHQRFDQLALDADSLADKDHALEQLATLTRNCVACHASYRFAVQTGS